MHPSVPPRRQTSPPSPEGPPCPSVGSGGANLSLEARQLNDFLALRGRGKPFKGLAKLSRFRKTRAPANLKLFILRYETASPGSRPRTGELQPRRRSGAAMQASDRAP